jgi:hypothetical protein
MRAAIYVRVSTMYSGQSPEMQLQGPARLLQEPVLGSCRRICGYRPERRQGLSA